MKNTIIKLASVALFLGLTACQEKLDNDNSNSLGNLSSVYMYNSNASVSFAKSTESGTTKFEIRMSNLRDRNETITIAGTMKRTVLTTKCYLPLNTNCMKTVILLINLLMVV